MIVVRIEPLTLDEVDAQKACDIRCNDDGSSGVAASPSSSARKLTLNPTEGSERAVVVEGETFKIGRNENGTALE